MLSLLQCVYPDHVKLEGHPPCRTLQLLIFTSEFWLRWVITPSCLLLPCCCVLSGLEVVIYSHELGCTAGCEMYPAVLCLAETSSSPASWLWLWMAQTHCVSGQRFIFLRAFHSNCRKYKKSLALHNGKKCQMSGTWKKRYLVKKTKIKGGSKELRARIAVWLAFVNSSVVKVRPEDGRSKIDEWGVEAVLRDPLCE